MTLQLDLVRHADALPKTPGGSDHERPLSALGHRQALMLAERLRDRGSYPEQVWCSSATRTRSTMAALGYDYTSVAQIEPRIYECEMDTLLELIAGLRPVICRAMIIGHNPGLQDLLAYLCGPEMPDMITAAHARIQLPERPGRPLRGKSRLREFWAP